MLNEVFGTGYVRFVVAFCIPCLLWLLCGSGIIKFFKKWQRGHNNVREYLDQNETKKNTPTLGGVPLYIFMMFSFSICCPGVSSEIVVFLIFVSMFFLIGVSDDYMKVFVNNTKGLSAKYKFIMECCLGIFFTCALSSSESYSNLFLVHVPLLNLKLDMGYWYFPFALFIISGAANAFNLTDGMDGLLSGVTLPILVALFCIGVFVTDFSSNIVNLLNTLTYVAALGGSIFGFLFFNRYPAKIFMGDSGSLMIGCSVAAVAVLIKIELLLAVLCIIPVIEALSVILQVLFFQLYGRRILIMAPIHHHFERKGIRENIIVFAMSIVSFLAAIFTFAIAFFK